MKLCIFTVVSIVAFAVALATVVREMVDYIREIREM